MEWKIFPEELNEDVRRIILRFKHDRLVYGTWSISVYDHRPLFHDMNTNDLLMQCMKADDFNKIYAQNDLNKYISIYGNPTHWMQIILPKFWTHIKK